MGKPLPSLCAPALQDEPAAGRGHPRPEPVGPLHFYIARLIGNAHYVLLSRMIPLVKDAIILKKTGKVKGK